MNRDHADRRCGGLEGILCIDKPQGFTSFDVVAKVRGMTRYRKVGHGGTLDPLATGVLPLFFGKAAKAISLLPNQDKRYTAGFRLGVVTDTQDITGRVVAQYPAQVEAQAIEAVLERFCGVIEQVPPMFSAVQVGGKRLYDLARQGIEIERKPRQITVYSIQLLDFCAETQEGILDVRCSKGTYIRTLCHDIGSALGAGGVMTDLRRTETMGFTLEECYTLEELEDLIAQGQVARSMISVESAFRQWPALYLSLPQGRMFLDGVRLDLNRLQGPLGEGPVRVLEQERFLGLAEPDWSTGELKMIKLFARKT